jgi:hypothetical protein
LARLEARVRDPVAVLKKEFFSARLEAVVSVPMKDLRNEFFSALLETELSVALKPIARALKTALASPKESVMDLDRDTCLEKLELSVNEPLSTLNSEFFSLKAEAEPTESVNDLARALVWEPVIDSELVRVL